MSDRVIFSTVGLKRRPQQLWMETPENILRPDTSFIMEQERNRKWQGHLMAREDESRETSAIWFFPRTDFWILPLCTSSRPALLKASDQPRFWCCSPASVSYGLPTQISSTESIFQIWANLLIMNAWLSGLRLSLDRMGAQAGGGRASGGVYRGCQSKAEAEMRVYTVYKYIHIWSREQTWHFLPWRHIVSYSVSL